MIRLATPSDHAAIDAFIDAHPDATPFHTRAWIEAVAKGAGQKSHVLIAGDPIRGVLPLNEIHSPLFGRALVSSGFAVGGGVLGEEADALAEAAWALAQERSCSTVELRGGALPSGWDVDADTYLNFSRELAADNDAELLQIPRKQRAEVRKALENGLEITIGDAKTHYAVYSESVRNLGTPVFPRSLFTAVLSAMDADILSVCKGGAPLASVLSLYWRGTVMPYWGGGTAAARPTRANDMMYYALMNHARARGCTRFDFGRSKAGTGAAAFKHNWGFEGVPLSYAKRSTGKARSVNPLDPQYSRKVQLWQKLPLPIANMIGPMIARGLG
jgi:FemAB-related protein (PEP-CTERM system-associated)